MATLCWINIASSRCLAKAHCCMIVSTLVSVDLRLILSLSLNLWLCLLTLILILIPTVCTNTSDMKGFGQLFLVPTCPHRAILRMTSCLQKATGFLLNLTPSYRSCNLYVSNVNLGLIDLCMIFIMSMRSVTVRCLWYVNLLWLFLWPENVIGHLQGELNWDWV